MPKTVLHVLAQRPGRTGSGVTLDALVRHAGEAGWSQAVVVGVPGEETETFVGNLARDRIHPLRFETSELPFPVAGMSDVMPYRSTRYRDLDADALKDYREAWRGHLLRVIDETAPDVIHAHHLWLVGAMMKDLAPAVPVVSQCHATGFRQMALCPHLAAEVREGCRRNDVFIALHRDHADEMVRLLQVSPERVRVVGAGYRDDLFRPGPADDERAGRLLYVGKYSAAKGVPWLLDAVERLSTARPGVELHVAGGGAGEEADGLRARMDAAGATVVQHGHLSQPELADLMRRCAVCVLPSFYEGVPLVLVEAAACGCRLVATRLPGVVRELAPVLGDRLTLVDLPRLEGVDTPHEPDRPAFVETLVHSLWNALDASPPDAVDLTAFSWRAVYDDVAGAWEDAMARVAAGDR